MTESIPLPPGFRASSLVCGVKPSNHSKPDLGLIVAEKAFAARAVFTQNQLVGAHVHLCREHLARSRGQVRAVLVNSGNANCATGEQGIADARRIAAETARLVGCPEEQVLYLSTGVIGARLPVDKIVAALPKLLPGLPGGTFADFTRAIMTTDTFPKLATRSIAGERETVTISGTAKGAGMIHPDMATMLGFLLSDGRSNKDLNLVLRDVCERTFHRVTVDGDTSPNDTVVYWSSEARAARATSPTEDPFVDGLVAVGRDLARMIARDGEGATRRVTIVVRGANSEREARLVGRTIGTSPLVKTAVHGRDPNWGRILAAAGRSGVVFDAQRARIWIGPAELFSDGAPHPENEGKAHEHLRDQEDVEIGIDLASGPYSVECWTCDYSAEYVSINADYRS